MATGSTAVANCSGWTPRRTGAEEYVKGYVEYFRSLGAVFLRMDFLAFYETGYDQSEGTVGVAHGRDSYVQALRWMREAPAARSSSASSCPICSITARPSVSTGT